MAYKCPTITIPGYTVTCEYVSNKNGKAYTSGQTLPTVYEADAFQIKISVPGEGDYCMCEFNYAQSNDDKVLAGWTLYDIYLVRGTINYKIPIPSSINGKNVTQYAYYRQFGGDNVLLDPAVADKLITGPVLPSGLKDISSCFKGCVNLQGLLEVNCNPTYYSNWLTGRTSSSPSLKLYGNSTMLPTLASGYSNVSAYIKMQAQLLAQRCNSSHQLDDEGTRMKLSLKIKGDDVGVNYTAEIKVNNSLVTTKSFTLNSSAEQTIVWYIDNTYSVDTTYDVSVTITSEYSGQTIETINISDTLTTAFYTMDFGNNGHQIAFGKPANANASDIPVNGRFDCAMDADFQGNLLIQGNNLIEKLKNMLCVVYVETLTVTAGTFTDSGCNASLVGNSLYLYLNATAKSAITAGNITNQTMLTINFTDNRISVLYSVSNSGGASGPNSQIQFKGASSGGQHTITVTLAAIAQNIAKGGVISAHASIPCVLNWDAY